MESYKRVRSGLSGFLLRRQELSENLENKKLISEQETKSTGNESYNSSISKFCPGSGNRRIVFKPEL